jgi:hypothetical protein
MDVLCPTDGAPEPRRHREPRSGVAIQSCGHWIASSAPPPRNDGGLPGSTAVARRAGRGEVDAVITFQDGTRSRIVTDLRVETVLPADVGAARQAAE